MSSLKELQDLIVKFRNDRDWKKFHNPKDLALSLVLESAEVLEHFQWKNGEDIQKHIESNKDAISHELADAMYWILLMANDLEINLDRAFKEKLSLNEQKYPIEKARGKSEKYTKL